MFKTSYLIILRTYLLIIINLDYKTGYQDKLISSLVQYHSKTINDNIELLPGLIFTLVSFLSSPFYEFNPLDTFLVQRFPNSNYCSCGGCSVLVGGWGSVLLSHLAFSSSRPNVGGALTLMHFWHFLRVHVCVGAHRVAVGAPAPFA